MTEKMTKKQKPEKAAKPRSPRERRPPIASAEALRESEERMWVALRDSPFVIFNQDKELRYTWIYNPHPGFTIEQVLGKTDADLLPVEDAATLTAIKRHVLESGIGTRKEVRTTIGGRAFFYDLNVGPLHDAVGNIVGIACSSMDITERKWAEAELIEKEAFNFALFEYNPIQTVVVDLEGKVIKFNLAKKKSGDRLPNIGDTMYKDYAGKHEIDMYAELMKCIRSGEENKFPEQKYGDRVLATTISPFPKGAVIISEDVTERKRAEEALREQHAILEGILASQDSPVFAVDAGYRYLAFNKSHAAVMKALYSANIEIGKSILDYHTVSMDRERAKENCDRALEGESIVVSAYVGEALLSRRYFEIYHNPIRDTNGDVIGVAVLARDITERKRAEEALKKSELRFRNCFDLPLIGFAITSPEKGWIEVNDRICSILGYSRDEVVRKSWPELTHPDDLAADIEQFNLVLSGQIEKYSMDKRFIRKDGVIVWTSISVGCIRDPDGRVDYIIGLMEDITERKRMEEEVRRKTKELREKNEELTRFTYAVSHDLKSPLVTIQTFQEHLERDIRSQDAVRVEKDLGYIRNAADKMGRLLDDIRRLSRVGRITNPSEEAPLQAIVKEALDLVAGRISLRGVKVQVMEEPIVLYGDRTRLIEIFMNLVDNAVKFMGDEPAPHVEIGVEQAGEELALYVRDNGIGIDPELQPLVFGLFHKLDPGSEGEGIGLALVKRIVELHGGRIWVESEGPGKGTTFRFTLTKTRRGVGREERT